MFMQANKIFLKMLKCSYILIKKIKYMHESHKLICSVTNRTTNKYSTNVTSFYTHIP